MTIASNIRPDVTSQIITAEELKEVYLFGVDLTDDDGNPFPKTMFDFYIKAAQNWLETQIPGLLLCEQQITNEVHDYYLNDYSSYGFLKLFRFPVTEVTQVGIQFPLATQVLTFDPSWYRVESVGAQVNLLPTQGTFSSILLSQGGDFLPLFYSGTDFVPSLWRVSYKAGYKKDACPPILRHIVGLKAMQGPLNIAGDLIAGAGIASKSLSIDGLSQSINTTASAENTGYGARITQANRDLQDALKTAQTYFTGLQMVVA